MRQGIGEFPHSDVFYLQLAEHLKGAGDLNGARDILKEGLSRIEDREALLAQLAKLLGDHFDKDAAVVRYNELLAARPEDPEYLTLRANLLLDLNLVGLALRDYKRADELALGKQAWITANIGNLLNNQGLCPGTAKDRASGAGALLAPGN